MVDRKQKKKIFFFPVFRVGACLFWRARRNLQKKMSSGLRKRAAAAEDEPVKVKKEEAEDDVKVVEAKPEDGEEEDVKDVKVKLEDSIRHKCPYLDTINRHVLDFDFEKVCSVSLSNLNVYCCLVCGKFFQGRGKNTHAYTHSVHVSHHVFINLHTRKIFCLPDNYEVVDFSLDDIVRALNPTFTPQETRLLNYNTTLARDIFGVTYLPGFIGLNNLKKTDYVNVVVHALAHVTPLRDFFLRSQNYENSKSQLVHRFGELMRKIWSKHNYKSCVSPHELVQEVTVASKRRFVIGKQSECVEFLSWLLNSLHFGLGGTRKDKSIIHEVFQGKVRVTTRQRKTAAVKQKEEELKMLENQDAEEAGAENWMEDDDDEEEGMEDWSKDVSVAPFLMLSLEIPPTPLFKDSQGGNIIPQVPLFQVLEKYNGKKYTDILKAGYQQRKRYSLLELPPFIIFHLSRFTKNNFYMEKNPTIVTFPVKNLELREYLKFVDDVSFPSDEELQEMSIGELKAICKAHRVHPGNVVEKAELAEFVKTQVLDQIITKYDLLANIVHDSPPGQKKDNQMSPLEAGSYRVHLQNKATDQWYEIQDLHVDETMPQLVGLSESYMLIYERQKSSEEAAADSAVALHSMQS
uniref:Ubiquitin specific peptidase 39 n=1 Tax=Ciliophrys infusionum TaxID=38824 RepID=X5IAE6_9STRA|nr:ubiquitin specific peptidase 39 [Ciliophrys infusionum]